MKHLLNFFIVLAISLCCSGCLDIVEDVQLNEDGSGQYQLTFDFRGMYNISSFEAIMEDLTWEEREFGVQPFNDQIDTVIYFKDLIAGRESEFKNPEFWEKVSMHTQFDRYQKLLSFEIKADFEQLSDIDDFYEEFGKIQRVPTNFDSNTDSGIELTSSIGRPLQFAQGVLFEWNKKSFTRHPVKRWEDQIDLDQLQFLKQFMPNATYKTVYHLPGKVKKSSIPNGKISDNVLTAEYPLLDIYEGEVQLEGEIRFK